MLLCAIIRTFSVSIGWRKLSAHFSAVRQIITYVNL
jgi:hypothetical protein